MSISPFQRLISNTPDVYLGADRDQAAENAANNTGNHPASLERFPNWDSLKKFANDISLETFSPFGDINNPEFIWDNSASAGQTAAFAVASREFSVQADLPVSFSIFLAAFADNAMEAKIELFEKIDGNFVKSPLQPAGLGDVLWTAGAPNTPAVGLTENKPFNWQDIRIYSTQFTVPLEKTQKIVLSFEVTNYLDQPPQAPNPAGLQFIFDIYTDAVYYLYVANFNSHRIDIYDISNPTQPAHLREFNGDNLSYPEGMALKDTTLYVTNVGNNEVDIYDILNPLVPNHLNQINGTLLDGPRDVAVTGTTLYVASSDNNTVQIYDIIDQHNPAYLDTINGGVNIFRPDGLAIAGTTLYVANHYANNVDIYDIATHAVPSHVGEFNGANLNGPFGMAVTGTTLYISNFYDNNVEIYDISDPHVPDPKGEFNAGNLDGPSRLAIIDSILYVANYYDNNIEIYEITDPWNPDRLGEFGGDILNGPSGFAIFTSFV